MLEIIFSIIILAVAVFAAWSAREAMNKGLTYAAMAAIIWTLAILAVARLWHTVRELFELGEIWGMIPTYIEYVLYLAAYLVFVFLVGKAFGAIMPSKPKEEKK